jgi:predicted Fe-Mo cluster-binding NifX family protein
MQVPTQRRKAMRVAMPISDRRVARTFDSAPSLLVVDVNSGGRIEFFETPARFRSLRERAKELAAFGVDVVLCDGISHALESMILSRGIEVLQHVSGNVDEVLDTYREQTRHDPRLFHRASPSVRQLNGELSSHTSRPQS